MTLAHARALVPGAERGASVLVIGEHHPEEDARALRALAAWCDRFAPAVSPRGEDSLLLDITGCAGLSGGEAGLVRRIGGALHRRGLTARIVAAPTFACAWAVARYGAWDRAIVPDGRAEEAVAPLPVAALDLGADVLAALAEVGIARVEHLLALPRASLPSRFGAGLLARLDRATGRDPGERLTAERPVEPPTAARVFDGASTRAEAVALAVRECLGELCARLAALESGARTVEVTLDRLGSAPEKVRIALSHPSRSPRHLWSLLAPLVERVNMGFGVEGVAVVARRVGRLAHRQAEAWESPVAARGGLDRHAGELVDALASRLGSERVLRIGVVESHVPERVFRLEATGAAPREASETGGGVGGSRETSCRKAALRRPSPERTWARRPGVLLERPEEARVLAMVPDGPPTWMRWRDRDWRVRGAAGPERVVGEWWAEGPGARHGVTESGSQEGRTGPEAVPCITTRDYFRVRDDEGRWLWVYRELETGRWFVHGVWG